MVFKVVLDPHAQLDIEEALEYYNSLPNSESIIHSFYLDLESIYKSLSINPFFQKRHKHFRCVP